MNRNQADIGPTSPLARERCDEFVVFFFRSVLSRWRGNTGEFKVSEGYRFYPRWRGEHLHETRRFRGAAVYRRGNAKLAPHIPSHRFTSPLAREHAYHGATRCR